MYAGGTVGSHAVETRAAWATRSIHASSSGSGAAASRGVAASSPPPPSVALAAVASAIRSDEARSIVVGGGGASGRAPGGDARDGECSMCLTPWASRYAATGCRRVSRTVAAAEGGASGESGGGVSSSAVGADDGAGDLHERVATRPSANVSFAAADGDVDRGRGDAAAAAAEILSRPTAAASCGSCASGRHAAIPSLAKRAPSGSAPADTIPRSCSTENGPACDESSSV